jgi:hypothetical protein
MIVGNSGCYLPQTAHDHESKSRCYGELRITGELRIAARAA